MQYAFAGIGAAALAMAAASDSSHHATPRLGRSLRRGQKATSPDRPTSKRAKVKAARKQRLVGR